MGRHQPPLGMTRITGLVGCACLALALALAGSARGGLVIGVTEDAGKTADGGAGFFATLGDVGLTMNRVSINWDPAQPALIQNKAEIDAWLPQAEVTHSRIVFAVAPLNARDLTSAPGRVAQFASFVGQLAQAFPQVKDYVIGNEPNQPRFWLPQFSSAGKPLSAAQYLPVLAQSYDALKAVDPAITVIGLGLSPRGNDAPNAPSNVSRSPVRFLRDLGQAYRASGRTKPLMDELAFHPYPARNNDAPDVGYAWPNVGLPNLDRLKQAVWDAFHGTAQPTFAETGARSFAKPLKLDLDEVGWQVRIPPALTGLYFGAESPGLVLVDEPTQATYYADVIELAACDPSVRLLSFFHLTDELDLDRWQSGLMRADGSRRPSYDSVKQTIARTHGDCQDSPAAWIHTNQVVLPFAAWGELRKARPASRTRWSFLVGAGEEATFRAGVFKAGPSKAVLRRRLTLGRPKPLLTTTGTIKAKGRVVSFPARKLKPGRYVYAIRMASTMNPQRFSVFVSPPFRVVAARRR